MTSTSPIRPSSKDKKDLICPSWKDRISESCPWWKDKAPAPADAWVGRYGRLDVARIVCASPRDTVSGERLHPDVAELPNPNSVPYHVR